MHFGNPADGKSGLNHQKYVERMKKDLRHISYLLKMCRRHSQGTDDYDQRVKCVLLEKGDCVLFKNSELGTLPCPGEVAEFACVQGEARDMNRRSGNSRSG